MPFWTKDAAEEMRGKITPLTNESNKKEIESDISFLQSMQTDRVATMGAFDKTNKMKEEKKEARLKQEEKKKSRETARRQTIDFASSVDNDVSDGDETDNKEDDYTTPKIHRRTVKTGTTLHLSQDFMKSNALVSTLIRSNVRPTATCACTLINEFQGDVNSVNIGWTQCYRYRAAAANNITEAIRDNWIPPAKAVIHWNGKLMKGHDYLDTAR